MVRGRASALRCSRPGPLFPVKVVPCSGIGPGTQSFLKVTCTLKKIQRACIILCVEILLQLP